MSTPFSPAPKLCQSCHRRPSTVIYKDNLGASDDIARHAIQAARKTLNKQKKEEQ